MKNLCENPLLNKAIHRDNAIVSIVPTWKNTEKSSQDFTGINPDSSLIKLIFVENHFDLKYRKIMTSLVSVLKERGYTTFCEEMSPMTLLKRLDNVKGIIADFKPLFEDQEEAINEYADIYPQDAETFYLTHKNKNENDQIQLLNLMINYMKVKAEYFATIEFKYFFKQLHSLQLNYQGVDSDEGRILEEQEWNKTEKTQTSLKERNESIRKFRLQRNEALTQAYCHSEESLFANIGFGHVQDIQELIIKNYPQKASQFCFIHIHSLEPFSKFMETFLSLICPKTNSDYLELQKKLNFSNSVKTRTVTLPLGIHLFDAECLSKQELIDALTSLIDIKNKELKQQCSSGKKRNSFFNYGIETKSTNSNSIIENLNHG
jgi:hypothetical protein